MGLFDSIFGSQSTNKPIAEQYAEEALRELNVGKDGDAVYHPMYKAWRAIQSDPASLKQVENPAIVGNGLLVFLSYGTVSDIDDRQQIISLAYLLLSDAIKKNPNDLNLIKNRILLMQQDREALEYTVSAAINPEQDIFSMSMFPFESRDNILKMIYSDLSKSTALSNHPAFRSTYLDLQNKICNNFFGSNFTPAEIINEGNKNHKILLTYLMEKVYDNEDIDF